MVIWRPKGLPIDRGTAWEKAITGGCAERASSAGIGFSFYCMDLAVGSIVKAAGDKGRCSVCCMAGGWLVGEIAIHLGPPLPGSLAFG